MLIIQILIEIKVFFFFCFDFESDFFFSSLKGEKF